MKAKQLMVGDLIYTRDITAKNYIRITAIDGAANFIRGIYLNNNEDTGWFSCDIAYEIGITEKILNTNGFQILDIWAFILRKETSDYILNHKGIRYEYSVKVYTKPFMHIEINYYIGLIKEGTGFSTCSIRLDYVHQLQHALRLCNLNDIADNFKLPQL